MTGKKNRKPKKLKEDESIVPKSFHAFYGDAYDEAVYRFSRPTLEEAIEECKVKYKLDHRWRESACIMVQLQDGKLYIVKQWNGEWEDVTR